MTDDKKAEDGFTMVPNWLIRESNLDRWELPVYIALLSRVNPAGECWPSNRTIAHDARCSESTAIATVRKLAGRGILTIQRRFREDGSPTTNLYRVKVPSHVAPTPGRYSPYTRVVQFVDQGGVATTDEEYPGEEQPHEEHPSEEHVTPKQEFGDDDGFSFPDVGVTSSQLEYLADLHIHYGNEIADPTLKAKWEKLTSEQASTLISDYLKAIGKYDGYTGPEYGEDTYNALSEDGKLWSDAQMIPEDVA